MSSARVNKKPRPVLIIGWDGAEWSLIDELCAEGLLPHFQRFRNHGTEAAIASLQPMLSPILWTSVATGKRGHEHGILGFVENGLKGPRAISSHQRKVPALWTILSEAGLICQVLNWWPSNPAEEILGDFVSNLAFSSANLKGQCWPEEWEEMLREKKQDPKELSTLIADLFFPEMGEEQIWADELVQKVARIIARTRHQFEIAMAMLAQKADCRFFYFEALDQLQHLAAPYHQAEDSPYRHILRAAYRWHDAMLGAFLKAAENHNVILLSDHGFKLSGASPEKGPDLPAAPALEHRAFGVFAAAGPDVKVGQSLYGISLLDLMPTLLHYFNLPLGRDLRGRKQDLFNRSHLLSFVPSWDPLVNPIFCQAEEEQSSTQLEDLADLDYIEVEDGVFKGISEEHQYNRAICLKEVGAHKEALQICEKHLAHSQKAYRWYILKARLLVILRDKGAWLHFWKGLNEQQQKDPHLIFYQALMYLQEGNSEAALQLMQNLEEQGLGTAALHLEMGQALFLAGNITAARHHFLKAQKLNSQSASALNGLAQLAFAQGQMEDFKSMANRSLALKMHQPQLHYLWALYYREAGEHEAAEKALKICLSMAPKHSKALALKQKISGVTKAKEGIIVSGFPRSGTSFMMALLEVAGIPLIRDKKREADQHNPRGYFEWEGVKDLPAQVKLPRLSGKALKVVAPLLPYLPADRSYKVVWMDRPIFEIILSQAKMRGDRASLEHFPFQKGQQLEQEKLRFQKWLDNQPHIEWKAVSYPRLMGAEAAEELRSLSEFLGLEISLEDWQKAADPQLHRNKIG